MITAINLIGPVAKIPKVASLCFTKSTLSWEKVPSAAPAWQPQRRKHCLVSVYNLDGSVDAFMSIIRSYKTKH